jgi:hypothetical protein
LKIFNMADENVAEMANPVKCVGKTRSGLPCKKKSKINGYCRLHVQYEKPEDCGVCTEKIEDEERPLSCGHWVHKECIYNWGKMECPVCRQGIKLTKRELETFQSYEEEKKFDIVLNFLTELIINSGSDDDSPLNQPVPEPANQPEPAPL